jgi:hypothetical protein
MPADGQKACFTHKNFFRLILSEREDHPTFSFISKAGYVH